MRFSQLINILYMAARERMTDRSSRKIERPLFEKTGMFIMQRLMPDNYPYNKDKDVIRMQRSDRWTNVRLNGPVPEEPYRILNYAK